MYILEEFRLEKMRNYLMDVEELDVEVRKYCVIFIIGLY